MSSFNDNTYLSWSNRRIVIWMIDPIYFYYWMMLNVLYHIHLYVFLDMKLHVMRVIVDDDYLLLILRDYMTNLDLCSLVGPFDYRPLFQLIICYQRLF
jgi:hypothetical protein